MRPQSARAGDRVLKISINVADSLFLHLRFPGLPSLDLPKAELANAPQINCAGVEVLLILLILRLRQFPCMTFGELLLSASLIGVRRGINRGTYAGCLLFKTIKSSISSSSS